MSLLNLVNLRALIFQLIKIHPYIMIEFQWLDSCTYNSVAHGSQSGLSGKAPDVLGMNHAWYTTVIILLIP